MGCLRRGWDGIGAQPTAFAKHPVLAPAGGAGALGKHKELRSWTHAGRWGDEASGFVWLVKEGWRGGSLSFNPSARVCVRNGGFLQVKYLKAKLNFGIVAYNSDWRERQVVSNPASFKAGASAWGVGNSEGTSEVGGTSGCS